MRKYQSLEQARADNPNMSVALQHAYGNTRPLLNPDYHSDAFPLRNVFDDISGKIENLNHRYENDQSFLEERQLANPSYTVDEVYVITFHRLRKMFGTGELSCQCFSGMYGAYQDSDWSARDRHLRGFGQMSPYAPDHPSQHAQNHAFIQKWLDVMANAESPIDTDGRLSADDAVPTVTHPGAARDTIRQMFNYSRSGVNYNHVAYDEFNRNENTSDSAMLMNEASLLYGKNAIMIVTFLRNGLGELAQMRFDAVVPYTPHDHDRYGYKHVTTNGPNAWFRSGSLKPGSHFRMLKAWGYHAAYRSTNTHQQCSGCHSLVQRKMTARVRNVPGQYYSRRPYRLCFQCITQRALGYDVVDKLFIVSHGYVSTVERQAQFRMFLDEQPVNDTLDYVRVKRKPVRQTHSSRMQWEWCLDTEDPDIATGFESIDLDLRRYLTWLANDDGQHIQVPTLQTFAHKAGQWREDSESISTNTGIGRTIAAPVIADTPHIRDGDIHYTGLFAQHNEFGGYEIYMGNDNEDDYEEVVDAYHARFIEHDWYLDGVDIGNEETEEDIQRQTQYSAIGSAFRSIGDENTFRQARGLTSFWVRLAPTRYGIHADVEAGFGDDESGEYEVGGPEWEDAFVNFASQMASQRGRNSNRRIITIPDRPQLDHHGVNLELDKKDYRFTFPIYAVHYETGWRNTDLENCRLIRPIGQGSWSNASLVTDDRSYQDKIRTFDAFMASNNVDVDDPIAIARANRLFGPYMGMELEIVARKDEHHYNEDEAELTHRLIVEEFHPAWHGNIDKKQIVYRVADGSVDNGSRWGHELVSQPMNLPAWQAVPFGFWKMLKDKYRAFYNHDGEREYGVGIHVHIDHSSMTTGHLWLLMQFAYHMQTGELKQHLETISQRPDGEWGRYLMPKHETGQTNPETGMPVYVDNLNEAIMLTAIRRTHDKTDKYDGINLQKENTIEFRWFQSHTIKNRVLKNIEFVDAMYNFAAQEAARLGILYYDTSSGQEPPQLAQEALLSDDFDPEEMFSRFWHFCLSDDYWRDRYPNLIAFARANDLFVLEDLFPNEDEYEYVSNELAVHDNTQSDTGEIE